MLTPIKPHSAAVSLLFLCLALACFGLGAHKIGFRAQSLVFVGVGIFMLFNLKNLRLKPLIFPALCFLVVLICGIFSFFDEVNPRGVGDFLKSLRTHILNPFLLFSFAAIFALNASRRAVIALLKFFIALCGVEILAVIFTGLWQGSQFVVPFFFDKIYDFNIWLIMPLALALSFLCVSFEGANPSRESRFAHGGGGSLKSN